MKLTIWTKAYRPFIMGGNVKAPIATEVEVGEPFDIGSDFRAYLVTSPKGSTYVVEATTGAFVGSDIEQVKKDVAAGDPEVMRQQIVEAQKQFEGATHLTPEEFWRMFRD